MHHPLTATPLEPWFSLCLSDLSARPVECWGTGGNTLVEGVRAKISALEEQLTKSQAQVPALLTLLLSSHTASELPCCI